MSAMMTQLTSAFGRAVAAGVPNELALTIVMTAHKAKLRTLFFEATKRFFVARQLSREHKSPHKEVVRCKSLLDLVLARQRALGVRRDESSACMKIFDAAVYTASRRASDRVVAIRKVA